MKRKLKAGHRLWPTEEQKQRGSMEKRQSEEKKTDN